MVKINFGKKSENIMSMILGKGSGWIIDIAIDHNISISKYNPLVGSSYIKLPKELDHSESLIVRYLNPKNHHPARI